MTPARKELDMDTYSGRFAARLKELREKAKITAKEAASRLGVSETTVFFWESGTRQPKISDLPKIAEAYSLRKTRDVLPLE